MKMQLTNQIENELPGLINFFANRGGSVDFIPNSVASVSTILYAQQENFISKGDMFFSLVAGEE